MEETYRAAGEVTSRNTRIVTDLTGKACLLVWEESICWGHLVSSLLLDQTGNGEPLVARARAAYALIECSGDHSGV